MTVIFRPLGLMLCFPGSGTRRLLAAQTVAGRTANAARECTYAIKPSAASDNLNSSLAANPLQLHVCSSVECMLGTP